MRDESKKDCQIGISGGEEGARHGPISIPGSF